MNALVSVRRNSAGTLSANRAARTQARRTVTANARADLLGRLYSPQTIMKSQAVASAPKSSTTTSGLDGGLGRDMFLQLLMAQMQHQDPLEPMDNSDMIAQLAQFSSLEQMNALNESFEDFSGNLDQLNFISAGSLLGREVTGIDTEGNPIAGTVTAVGMNGSLIYLTVDGRQMSMAGVLTLGVTDGSSSDEAPPS